MELIIKKEAKMLYTYVYPVDNRVARERLLYPNHVRGSWLRIQNNRNEKLLKLGWNIRNKYNRFCYNMNDIERGYN